MKDGHRYIICITNEVGTDNSNRIRSEDVQLLLKQFGINLIVLGFGQMDGQSRREFEDFTNATNDGRVLMNPTHADIKDLFLQISNYTFQSTPLILETFN